MHRLSHWVVRGAFVLVAIVAVLAVVDNREKVALHFLNWTTAELSVYWWLVGAFALGISVGWLGAGVQILRVRAGTRQLRRELGRSQAELQRSKREAETS
jgi:lipopolysaccharide assembly protein A